MIEQLGEGDKWDIAERSSEGPIDLRHKNNSVILFIVFLML